MFTGRRTGVNSSTYTGDIVIFHNRPFGLDASGTTYVPAGERVVEAIFGYGTTVSEPTTSATIGYSPQARTVLLRWPVGTPDPDVRTGGWIADVTYEKNLATSTTRYFGKRYSGQRCHWYRVVRHSDGEPDPDPGGLLPVPTAA